MRFVSTILTALIFACLLLAQAPIGFGPGTLSPGLIDVFDWYTATASGCTVGSRGMCVGTSPRGDTIYFSGWFADAHLLPVTTGLPVVGTLNDFTSKTCSGNIMVIQLAEFSWAARNASRIYEINCMSGYGANPAGTDSPSGWKGHCTANDEGGQGCSWKSRAPFVRGGLLYLPVERQIPTGATSVHDATLIVSADGGQTWKNPYSVAHGGAASATGDAPLCGAPAAGAGNPCTDASYPGSIMWQAMPAAASQWEPVQYGQDGATPPAGINDGCDPALYTCFMAGEQEATIARVLNTDLPSLDVTKYQYYTCPTITDTYRCPGDASSSWTSTFGDRTPVMNILRPGSRSSVLAEVFGIAYVREFKSYLMTGSQYRDGGVNAVFASAPTIQGPWTLVLTAPSVAYGAASATKLFPGFISPSLALGYTVISTNPPHVQITTVNDTAAYTSQTTPLFGRHDLVLGRTPMLQGGENPRYSNQYRYASNAGYVFSDSHATGTIPRKDLVWAFDFYDHGGDTAATGVSGFHDVASGSAFLTPCQGGQCAYFNPGQGSSLTSFGAQLADGYSANLTTVMHDTPQTIAIGAAKRTTGGLTLLNAPAAMQGNGTFTVAGIFRYDTPGFNQVSLWSTGDASSTNTAVALNYNSQGGTNLELGWGITTNRWRYNSGLTLIAGNWYFVACTVQANGDTPVAHLWIGEGGVLADKFAGVSRVSTGGNPTQTPNVASTALILGGVAIGATHAPNASYAGLFVYSRMLGQAEVGLMYRSMKSKMTERGVTLQ